MLWFLQRLATQTPIQKALRGAAEDQVLKERAKVDWTQKGRKGRKKEEDDQMQSQMRKLLRKENATGERYRSRRPPPRSPIGDEAAPW